MMHSHDRPQAGIPTAQEVLRQLARVNDPLLRRSLMDLDMVQNVRVDEQGRIRVVLHLPTPAYPHLDRLREDVRSRLARVAGAGGVDVEVQAQVTARVGPPCELARGVRNLVALLPASPQIRTAAVGAGLAEALAAHGTASRFLALERPLEAALTDPDPDHRGHPGPGELDYLLVETPAAPAEALAEGLNVLLRTPLAGAVIITTAGTADLETAKALHRRLREAGVPCLGMLEVEAPEPPAPPAPPEGAASSPRHRNPVDDLALRLGVPWLGGIRGHSTFSPESAEKVECPLIARELAGRAAAAAMEARSLWWLPVELRYKRAQHLEIDWKDGHLGVHGFRSLREACSCARCRDEWTGKRLVRPETIPPDIRPTAHQPVGRYALQFFWSDGHDSGIYTHTYLRGLCECEECRP